MRFIEAGTGPHEAVIAPSGRVGVVTIYGTQTPGNELAVIDIKAGTPITAFEALAAGKPIVATDADGLLDILTNDRDAVIVPKRNAAALAEKIIWAIDHPAERARLAAAARVTGRKYGIDAFVTKMERLYTLMHEVSRPTHRRGVAEADLSFLG